MLLTRYSSILLSSDIFRTLFCYLHISRHRRGLFFWVFFVWRLFWHVFWYWFCLFIFKKFLIYTIWFLLSETPITLMHPVLLSGWFSLAVANLHYHSDVAREPLCSTSSVLNFSIETPYINHHPDWEDSLTPKV